MTEREQDMAAKYPDGKGGIDWRRAAAGEGLDTSQFPPRLKAAADAFMGGLKKTIAREDAEKAGEEQAP